MSFLSKTSFNQKDPQPTSKNLQIKQALTKCEGRLEVGFGHLSFLLVLVFQFTCPPWRTAVKKKLNYKYGSSLAGWNRLHVPT